MAQLKQINDAVDWHHTWSCGCRAVFLGSCLHRTSRFEACLQHDKRHQFDLRTRMREEAKEDLRMAKLERKETDGGTLTPP